MIRDAKNHPISQLFDPESVVIYAIPKYQREFTWNKNHWERLFDDIMENNPGYFLGSIICINQSTDTLGVQELELVDGQQRMMTLSLLFAAVYNALTNNESNLDEEYGYERINLKRKLVLKKESDKTRLIPQIQNNNKFDYLGILSEIGVLAPCGVPPYAGNRKIFRAYRYFQTRLEEMVGDDSHKIEAIIDFLDKVNKACLVKIEVATHADAYTLFESLNNRGMPLTAIDLIKNKLLSQVNSSDPEKVDHYFNHWTKILEYLGDNYGIQERFFRQFYNAFKGKLKKVYSTPVATRSNLIHIYEKLINYDPEYFLKTINEAARLYSLLLLRNQDDALKKLENDLEKPLRDLDRIQGATSYLLLLYLLVRQKELHIRNAHLFTIVSVLVRFFVRRNLTDIPPTRDLTKLFMTIIEDISDQKGEFIVNAIRQKLIKHSASEEEFCRKLEGPIYEENYWVARFILSALAEQGMTRETKVDLWQLDGKRFVWTIEHIFPQGENIPASWVKMIAGGDEKMAKEIQQTHVHKLGNLTISGFNSTLGNKSFHEKRDRKDSQGREVGYKNNLKLNEDLASTDSWSVEQIEQRTKKMVNQTIELFRLDVDNF